MSCPERWAGVMPSASRCTQPPATGGVDEEVGDVVVADGALVGVEGVGVADEDVTLGVEDTDGVVGVVELADVASSPPPEHAASSTGAASTASFFTSPA